MPVSAKSQNLRKDVGGSACVVRQVTYIGNFLSRHGLNPTYAEALVPRLRDCGFNVISASSHLNGVFRLLDMMQAVVRTSSERACAIIDLYGGPRAYNAAIAVARLCRILRKRYIVTLHGGSLLQRLDNSRASLLSMLRGAALVTSPSAYLAQSFAGLLPVSVIPNGLDVSAYSFRLRSDVRPRCLYLRAFHRFLDPMTAIRAFALVKREHPDAILRMVGPDEDGTLANCHGLVSELKLEGSVEFSGRIPKAEVPGLANSFDIFINATHYESFGVAVMEAAACGLCIVSTNVGELPLLWRHGQDALLVPPGDVSRMAEEVRRILTVPGLAERLSSNARAKAETFDWSFILPLWEKAISRVCAQQGD